MALDTLQQHPVVVKPGASLAPYVHSYLFATPDTGGEEVRRDLLLPSENTLIVLAGNSRYGYESITTPNRCSYFTGSYVIGPNYRGMHAFSAAGNQTTLAVILKPGTLQLLTGIDTLRLQSSIIPISDLKGTLKAQLATIDPAGNPQAIATRLDALLLLLINRNGTRALKKFQEFQLLLETLEPGATGKYDLENFYATSALAPKSLKRSCARYIGLLPKQYLRVKRLHAIINALEANEVNDWRGFAREHGYHDYPHLYKDIKDLIGMTPRDIPSKIRYRLCSLNGQIVRITLSEYPRP